MSFFVRFTNAVVVVGQGPDHVLLTTDIIGPFPDLEPLAFKFDCPKGAGQAYLKQHFEIDAEVICLTKTTPKYSDK